MSTKGKSRTRTARRDLLRSNAKSRNRLAKAEQARQRVKSYDKQVYDGNQDQEQES